jgi:predicted acetyltransferase
MIERHLADCRERGEPLAVLWASEGSIYGRFGYGLASISCDIDFPRDRAAFALPAEPGGRVRLVGLEEAAAAFPPVYDRVRRETAGMLSRSETWWADKTLVNPDYFGQGSVPLRHAVLELDGAVEGYAMYRVHKGFGDGAFSMTLQVVEAIATSPRATQLLWEFLFGIDLVGRIHSRRLPPDHPLYLGVTEPARLMMRMGDGLWLRLVDLEAALAARTLRPAEPVVVEVADEHCSWNAGVWQLGPDGASRSSGAPDVRLGVAELGCAYLGCFTFAQLRWTGRLDELTPGAVERLDAMFRTDRFPWCPEVF